ncbi:hypothetical protein [Desulfurobacterium atlanticum]|uniref:Uncharacterized protein n=1 Tax=Desulfurobacterium atlanticum TaxID=240169 RepID=A0A238ZL91_9BACT|nr:hypothetical protein [Desulfurobacterium atlanticum]SNR83464.1 hypothetical protein SAMN06265340_10926 [Desulfurobacterium atlanticum]
MSEAKKASKHKQIERAAELYTAFHFGKLPKMAKKVKLYFPENGIFTHLGKLLAVIYLSDKGDGVKPYIHFFGGEPEPFRLVCNNGNVSIERIRKIPLSKLPDLLTDPEGKHLYIANYKGRVKPEGITG